MPLPPSPVIYEVNTIAWLSELSRREGRPITLGTVTRRDWDAVAGPGIHALWLMGVWERSPAGLTVALANPGLRDEFRRTLPDLEGRDVAASPYCIRRYVVDRRFGGTAALARARAELAARGVSLILDFVPNHLARDHPWVEAHPDYFIHGTEAELAGDPLAFFRVRGHVIACGRDPFFPPWSDVAQVNAFAPDLRAAFARTLADLASMCDGVRCDMAMLVMNDVFHTTWGRRAGAPPARDFWPEVMGVVRARAPAFAFIAEAYWDREGALLEQGFDYCYDKQLYDQVRHGDPRTVRAHLRAERAYQDRLVRFVENHDEARAAAVFGPARSRAAAALVTAVPGATLLHQGQLDGRAVRIPVFLTRWPDEALDASLRAFYSTLLREVGTPPMRTGSWHLLECRGWADNDTSANLVACSWDDGINRCLVIVNLSAVASQARVSLPWLDLGTHRWVLRDPINGDVYDRNGEELSTDGLFVDLQPWHFHWLRLKRRG
jgi:alpha amylase-like protein